MIIINLQDIEKKLGYDLSEEQKAIMEHDGSPLAVIACAGSGKTTTIETKMIYDIENKKMKPEEILCITFSKAAQEDMVNRYDELSLAILNKEQIKKPLFSTFHSYFFNQLKSINKHNYKLVNIGNYTFALNKVLNFKLESGFDVNEGITEMLNYRAFLINTLQSSDGLEGVKKIPDGKIFNLNEYLLTIKEYESLKLKKGEIDFEDMQSHLFNILKNDVDSKNKLIKNFNRTYKKIYIDEFQDISLIQFQILYILLNNDYNNLCVIGDDDQSIYRFRGSSPEFILKFKIIIPDAEILYLSTNYRCRSEILDNVKKSISANTQRFNKPIKAFKKGGFINFLKDSDKNSSNVIYQLKNDLAEYPDNKFAILCRTNLYGSIMADKLATEGIDVYFKSDTQILQKRSEFEEIMSVLKILKFNDLKEFEKNGHKLLLMTSKQLIKQFAIVSKEEKIHWIETIVDAKKFYTTTNISELRDLVFNIQSSYNLASDLRITSQALLPFYEKLYETSGSTKINKFKIIFDYLIEYAEKYNLTYDEFLNSNSDKQNKFLLNNILKNGIAIMTFHGAKGLEFDNVYVINAVNSLTPGHENIKSLIDKKDLKQALEYLEEERRLFYVACTRAKYKLRICYAPENMSIFVHEILTGEDLTLLDAIQGIDYNIYAKAFKAAYDNLNINDKNIINTLMSNRLKSQINSY